MLRIVGALFVCLILAAPAHSQEVAKNSGTPTVVPFKLTRTQHVMVRVKIDGKGPFHFVVDTGCPVLVISTEAAKKAGLESVQGVGIIKKLDFEGGLSEENVKARIETPFQIEGMNNMGLPGVELHGLMGYTVLAKYKMEIDLSRERMVWTPLAFEPPPLAKLKLKDGSAASIEIMGTLLKVLSRLSGLKPSPPGTPRGFAGIELEQAAKRVRVARVLDDTPAGRAGLKAGDELQMIGKQAVATLAEALAAVAAVRSGEDLTLEVSRGGERLAVQLKTATGF
jgi:hypothetical protein